MKILVTGAAGQLGQCLQAIAQQQEQYQMVWTDRSELDIADAGQVSRVLATHRPTALINAAAYTAVDRAETEEAAAYRINSDAPEVLAMTCREQGCRFIHVSTDYVFDGLATTPYLPADATNPQSVYGHSKLAGEQRALAAYPEGTTIVRTSWVYSAFGANFVKTMLRLMNEREVVRVVADQQGCPTYAMDLAEVLLALAAATRPMKDIYHYANTGAITWYDFAVAIRDLKALPARVEPITTADYPTAAKRPAFSVLESTAIAHDLNISLKPWRERLAACLKELP